MGGGGQHEQVVVNNKQAAADAASIDTASIKAAIASSAPSTTTIIPIGTRQPPNPKQPWTSPFTPNVMDPRVAGKSLKEINAQFPTKSEIRAVIPPHCFERSLVWSFYYIGRDFFMTAIVAYVTYHTLSTETPEGGLLGNPVGWLAWRLGWNIYGIFMTAAYGGLWVIGHECGHGAFSDYPVVNDTVGWILHSSMLVPYFTWAFSHAKHHRRTNDLIEGETHVPPTYEDVGLCKNEVTGQYEKCWSSKGKSASDDETNEKSSTPFMEQVKIALSWPLYWLASAHEFLGEDAFSGLLMWCFLGLGFWMYITGIHSVGHLGNDGKPIYKGTFPDHFRPWSRMFPPKMYWKVVLSNIGLGITTSILAYCCYEFGFQAVWFWYGGPYLWINAMLVAFTWLQHTDPTVPHMDAENWTWIKGALAGTIDRPLHPPFGVSLSHHIVTTHVVHHLFHELPHYHAVEATAHVRAYLEPKGLYNYDPTPFALALWKVACNCHFVDSKTNGVQYYHNFRDVPTTTTTTNNAATGKMADAKKNE